MQDAPAGGTLNAMDPQISRLEDRFQIEVDGAPAGFTMFVDHDGRRVFFHTEVRPEYNGQGLAGQVVQHALEATRDEGVRIVAVCPYVRTWLQRHDGFEDAVDTPTPDDLAAIPRG